MEQKQQKVWMALYNFEEDSIVSTELNLKDLARQSNWTWKDLINLNRNLPEHVVVSIIGSTNKPSKHKIMESCYKLAKAVFPNKLNIIKSLILKEELV